MYASRQLTRDRDQKADLSLAAHLAPCSRPGWMPLKRS